MRILLVEDDIELAEWTAKALSHRYGFVVEWAEDGDAGDRLLRQDDFDAVVLDLGLPELDGRSLLAKMRARGDVTPTLILTARDSLTDRIETLHAGADDFLSKPFAIEELEARLTALIRRAHGRNAGSFSCGALTYHSVEQSFTINGERLELTPREHAMLRILIQHAGQPMSKQKIMDRMFAYDADIQLEAIEVIAHRLRKKVTEGVSIRTLRGLGYVLELAST